MQRRIDQPRAIVERNDLNAFRQHAGIESVNFRLDGIKYARRILAFSHQDHACNDVVIAVLCGKALARYSADFHGADILNKHGRSVTLGNYDVADIVSGLKQADPANQILLFAFLNVTSAGVCTTPVEAREQLLK